MLQQLPSDSEPQTVSNKPRGLTYLLLPGILQHFLSTAGPRAHRRRLQRMLRPTSRVVLCTSKQLDELLPVVLFDLNALFN